MYCHKVSPIRTHMYPFSFLWHSRYLVLRKKKQLSKGTEEYLMERAKYIHDIFHLAMCSNPHSKYYCGCYHNETWTVVFCVSSGW